MVTYLTLDSSVIVASLREHVIKYIGKQKGDVTDTPKGADMIGKLGWKPRKGSDSLPGDMRNW